MTTKNANLDITISPVVLSELIDIADPAHVDGSMRILVQEIIDNAKIFIARFQGHYFLKSEKIHDFVGLEFRDEETSLIAEQHRYRLIINGPTIGIFSTKEIPIDEMYDIRLLIAESQLPEFSEDTHPKS